MQPNRLAFFFKMTCHHVPNINDLLKLNEMLFGDKFDSRLFKLIDYVSSGKKWLLHGTLVNFHPPTHDITISPTKGFLIDDAYTVQSSLKIE